MLQTFAVSLRRAAGRAALLTLLLCPALTQGQSSFMPGSRTTLDAHNCYPYEGRWSDRIDLALAQGLPIAIEQDLTWYAAPKTGKSKSVLAHTSVFHGNEPTLDRYFFERIRPIIEAELAHPNRARWPIITLNLDIKTEEPEHLRAIYRTLERYSAWLTTATNVADVRLVQPLHPGPLLVLAGPSDALEQVFHREVPLGAPLLVFGAVHPASVDPTVAPEDLEREPATNYRRWWNNSWATVEAGGPSKAGEWTPAKNERVRRMVEHAHSQGLWIRFYTLDGATQQQQQDNGWFKTYSFASLAAAKLRWSAAIAAHVDYLATDQYEDVRQELHSLEGKAEAK